MLRPTLPVTLRLLPAVLVVASALAWSGENAPFLTTARLTNPEEVAKGKVEIWVAEKKKVAYVWSDSVFAIHVPFHLETKQWTRGDVIKDVGKKYEVTAIFTGFTYRDPKTGKDVDPYFDIKNVGYYLFNSAFGKHLNGRGWSASAKPGKSGPVWMPLYSWSVQTAGPAGVWLVVGPDGWRYTSASTPMWTKHGAEAQGTVHVTVRKKEKGDTGIAAKVDVPLRIRQNGWVVLQAKATTSGAWGKEFGRDLDHRWVVHDRGTTGKTSRLFTTWRYTGTPCRASAKPVDCTVTLDIQLSRCIWDLGVTPAYYTFAQTAGGPGHWKHPFLVERCKLHLFGPLKPDEDGKLRSLWNQSLYVPNADSKYLKKPGQGRRYTYTEKFHHGMRHDRDGILPGRWVGESQSGTVGPYHMGRLELALCPSGMIDRKIAAQRPRKVIDLYGMRLNQMEDNSKGMGTVEVVKTPALKSYDDSYMAWLPRHGAVVRKNLSRINTIRGVLQALKVKIAMDDVRFRNLLRLSHASFQWRDPRAGDDFIEQVFSGGRAANKTFETLTPGTLRALKAKREALHVTINAARTKQRELIAEALKCMQNIVDSVEGQALRSKGRRKDVAADVQKWSDQSRTLAADLYYVAGLWEEMEAALSRYDYGSDAVQEVIRLRTAQREKGMAELAERKLWLQHLSRPAAKPEAIVSRARQHEVNAWKATRDVLALNPQNAEAISMLRESELAFLRYIGQKLARERKVAYDAFRTYLVERGYDPDGRNTWSNCIYERLYAFVATGPVGTASAFLGKPQAMAERTSTIELQAATAQMSLMYIIRLRRAGMSMAEIRKITPERLRECVPLRTVGDDMLDDLKVRRIVQDIYETFADLYDLQALAGGDAEKLMTHLGRTYYSPEEVVSTWPEFIGDLFSARHLFLLLGPSAVAKIGGKWQVTGNPFGTWRSVQTRVLSVGGEVRTGHDLLAATLQIDRLGAAFARTKLGGPIARAVQADADFVAAMYVTTKGLPTWRTYVAQGGTAATRLAAAFVLYGGAHHFADEYNLPRLKTFIDAMAYLGVGHMAHQALTRVNILPRTALRKIATYEKIIQQERRLLARDQQAIADLRDIHRKLKARARPAGGNKQPLTPAEVDKANTIAKATREGGVRPVAGTNANADTARALEAAARALRNGDDKAASRALDAAGQIVRSRANGIRATGERAVLARKNAEAMLREPRPKLKKFDQERTPEQVPVPERFIPRKEITSGPDRGKLKKAYDELGDIGYDLRRGDQAFRNDDLRLARKSYREARKLCAGNADDRALLDRRINLATNGRQAKRIVDGMRKETRPLRARESLGETEAREVVRLVEGGDLKLRYHAGSANPVFFVRDPKLPADAPPRYVFKINKYKDPKQPLGGNPDELVAEELGAVLANALGIASPGTRRATMNIGRITHGKKVYEGVKDGVLMRFLPGKELHELGEDIIVGVKENYARIRVLRAWLGDFDGHPRNLMLGTDGELYLLDAGYACWRKAGTPMNILLQKPNLSQKELVEYAVKWPQLMSKAKRGTDEARDYALYHWIDRIDDMVHYNGMAPMIDDIQALCRKRAKLEELLGKVIGKHNPVTGAWEPNTKQVKESADLFIERSKHLHRILGDRFSRLDPRRVPTMPAALSAAA